VVTAVNGTAKPIMALCDGGRDFLAELGLTISNVWGSTKKSIHIANGTHPVLNIPNIIDIPGDSIIQLYDTGLNYRAAHLPTIPDNIVVLGREADAPDHYPIAIEDDRYLLWGFAGSPGSMTQDGKDLFINVIAFMLT
jgi:hypothetical protein